MRGIGLCLLLALHCAASAQHLSLFDIDGSQFPRVTAKFYAFDALRKQARPTMTEVNVRENGIARAVLTVNCPAQTPPLALSSVLVMDVSGSMSVGKGAEKNIDLARHGAKIWIAGIPLGASECAIVSFDDENYLNQDFTTNAGRLIAAADSLKAMGGTDYDKGLLQPSAGGLIVAERGRYKRVIVFLTDGLSSTQPNVATIVAEAQRLNCAIYCVTLGMGCPQSLRDIADQTGGVWFENLLSESDVNNVYYTILMDAQGGQPCTVEWLSDFACEVPDRQVVLGWNGVTSERTYASSPSAITRIDVNPQPLYMRSKAVGVSFDTTITITNGIAPTTVTNVTSSHPAFDVNPKAFSMVAGQSIALTLTYTPPDSGYTYATFTVESEFCRRAFYASASYPNGYPKQPTIKVLSPNGGEQFAAGGDTVITWTGVPPTDRVRLEYSSDGGVSWTRIAEGVTGGTYKWRVPGIAGDKYLVRVTQLPLETVPHTKASVVLLGHTGFVIDVDWDSMSDRVVTGSSDFTAKIWDAHSGYEVWTLREHTSGLSRVRFSPDGTKVATGGNDTRLFIWDAFSGARIRSLVSHTASLRGIGWSPDGTELVSLSWNGECRSWNTQSGAISIIDLSHSVFTIIDWHPLGNAIALGGLSGSTVFATKPGGIGSGGGSPWGPTNDIEWGDNGTALLGGCVSGDGYIWRTWGRDDIPIMLKGHTKDIHDVTWCPDGTKVATASEDSTVKIWDSKFGLLQRTLVGHASAVQQVDWSPNGKWIASSSEDTAFVWDAATGALHEKLVGHTGRITKLLWSPDGQRIVTSSRDSTARIWDVDAGLQRDTSDTTFAVIAPQPISQDIDMGRVLVGVSRDSVVTTIVRNAGALAFHVAEILIQGNDASHFSIVSGGPPFTVEPNAAHAVEFRFLPTTVGIKSAPLAIRTQSETLQRTIVGEGILPSLEFISKIIDFGVVDVGRKKDTLQAATIKNISNDVVVVRATRHAGPNTTNFTTLASPVPLTLQPGDTARIDLRFAPTSVGRTSGRLLLEYVGADPLSSTATGSPASVTLFGEGRASGPLIAVDSMEQHTFLCSGETRDTVIVYNRGVGDLVITSVALSGPGWDELALDNVVLPITIAPDSSAFIRVVINRRMVGTTITDLVFTSNSFIDSVFVLPLVTSVYAHVFDVLADTIDLGVVCPDTPITTQIDVVNAGQVAMYVDATSTIGQLSATRLSLPVSNGAGIDVTIPGGSSGPLDVVVTLTDSCGRTRDVHIIGTIERPELQVRDLTIRAVVGGVAITKQLVISNPTGHTIAIATEPPIAPFTFSPGSFPLTIQPNDSATLGVSYVAADTTTRTVDVVLDFSTLGTGGMSACQGSATGTISGRGVNAYARIAINRVAGYPGDIIQVPVVLEDDVNLITSGATTINVQLRMNATLLDPIVSPQQNPPGATPGGLIVNNERVIDYEFPIAESVNGVLANLRFKVMLGNDSVTAMALHNPQANNASVLVESVDGEFNLLGTCLVGGARLLNPSGTARIVGLSPNPAGNEIEIAIETIERGNTTIIITDALGRSVAHVFEGNCLPGSHVFPFDASPLGSGNYFVKLQTPTVVHTAMLRILK